MRGNAAVKRQALSSWANTQMFGENRIEFSNIYKIPYVLQKRGAGEGERQKGKQRKRERALPVTGSLPR